MKMKELNHLSVDAKIAYLLSLSDLVRVHISNSDGYEVAVEALEKCWDWVRFRNIKADKLYYYLENMDEVDVMTYMQIEDNPVNESVWICIANALAYTIWEAYQYEKAEYLPQTIECVDDETLESFLLNFEQVYEKSNIANELLHYLKTNYPEGTEKQIDINAMKDFIDRIV